MFREERRNWRTYHNVCTGKDMVDYLMLLPHIANMENTSFQEKRLEACELIHDMVNLKRIKIARMNLDLLGNHANAGRSMHMPESSVPKDA
jgi:hypothetical protein